MTYETKDSGKRATFATGMQRDTTEGKTRYDLIIPESGEGNMLKRWAELMTRGAIKYEERNWEKACTLEELKRYRESAFRHFIQWYMGQTDEDHGAAVFFNIQGAEYVKERLDGKTNT
jgi:hypothetical protein